MSRIPPEIDRLMWAVAESPVPDAMDEFGKRHPELKAELLKRVEMVRGLRNEVKTGGQVKHQIPKFEPRPLPSATPQKLIYVAFVLGVTATAFAAFTAITSLKSAPPPAPVIQPVNLQPLEVPPVIVKSAPVVPNNSLPSPPAPVPVVHTDQTPLAEKRRDLKLSDVQLLDALSLITSGTNMKVEVGPGFVNQKVTLMFRQKTTKEMLVEMAKQYAFTVSDEGEGQFLVLPVPDNGTESSDHLNAQRRIGP